MHSIKKWCNINGMILNTSKCSFISFTRKLKRIDTSYSLDSVVLDRVDEIRDLGVTLDSKLKFATHVNNIVKNAAKILGFLKRALRGFKQNRTRIILYNSMVRSCLEYSSTAWNPVYAAPSQRLESIQRAFTRYLAFLTPCISHKQSYYERLSFFNMNTLKTRRTLSDLIFLHKVLNGKISCADLISSINFTVPFSYPRQPLTNTFSVPRYRTNLGLHLPLARICSTYNNIFDVDIINDNQCCFKSKILKHLSFKNV